ncbi:hypothetical protein EPN81_04650 [Patescibacteria group bacterium]|nr:MAG: hypothetical protein EPN81_04650 [Patescibacteria group bacterium]
MGTIPVWLKDLIDKYNLHGDDAGVVGMLNHFAFVMRIGQLLVSTPTFSHELTAFVETHERKFNEAQTQIDQLKTLRYPELTGKNWKAELHAWMQEVLDAFLDFHVDVPVPPNLNRAQRRLLKKYKLWLFFVPAISEDQYPEHIVKLDRDRYLPSANVTSLPLPGRWIAWEVIKKPNYQDGRYPDDQLMTAVDIDTRFAHPHSQKGEGDDLMEDILPKVATVLKSLGGEAKVQSARIFNFLGNLFNWLRIHTSENRLPDLGSTNSVEWCEERCGSHAALLVGLHGGGGLVCVGSFYRDDRDNSIAFRFLVQFEPVAQE